MPGDAKTLRIFISSPGDVAEERDKAKQVVADLQRRYDGQATLIPVLWEDLAIPATASFQEGIDFVLAERHRIDIAVFILWSRLGNPLGGAITRPDGSPYLSGTEREFDLMLAAFEQSGGKIPIILAYTRSDDEGFNNRLDATKQGDEALEELIKQRKLVKQFISERFQDTEGHNIRAYHSYREPVGFAQRLHVHLRGAVDELLELDSTAVTWTEAPYRSLEVFDIRHAPIFCGRDEETCDLLQRLRDQARTGCAFVCIVGASGSGKSSLARAGVAATLMQRSFDEGVKEWRAAVFLPSLAAGDLFLAVARSLAEPLSDLHSGVGGIERFAKRIEDNHEAAADLLEAAFKTTSDNLGGPLRLLLVLDQMEELWTDRSITPDQREKFLQAIESLARSGRISVLATLRSDFYPQAQLSPAFLRMKGERGHFDLTPPGPAALHELIVQPAHRAGLRFERDPRTEGTLDQRILAHAARDPSALPLLQYSLAELYERRDEQHRLLTFAAYEAMGGVEGALGQRAAHTFDGLPAAAQAALDELLPLLISVDIAGEQNAVRRRAPLANLTNSPARRHLTEALIAARFLTTDEQSGTPIATLAHEALLRRWDRITTWINTNRDLLRMRARIEQYEAMWEESGRDVSRLLPVGLPLEEGRELMEANTHVLSEKTRQFVLAASLHHAEQHRRAVRLRRLAFAVLSGLTVLAFSGGGVAWWMKSQADRERDKQDELLWAASRGDHEAAMRAFSERRHGEGLALLDRALGYRPMNTTALLASADHAFGINSLSWRTRSIATFYGAVYCIAFSPDGRYLAVGSEDKTARVIEVVSGKEISRAELGGVVRSVSFSPDGRSLAVGSNDKIARVIEVATGKEISKVVFANAVWSVSFSPDGRHLAVGSHDKTVRVIEAATGKEISRVEFGNIVTSVMFSPDGRYLAAANADQTARVIEVATGKQMSRAEFDGVVRSVNFSPDGRYVAVGSGNPGGKGEARVTEAATGEEISKAIFGSPVYSVGFSPDGRYVAAGSGIRSGSGEARVIETATGKEISRVEFGESVHSVSFSADGRYLAAGSFDKTARLIEAATGKEISRLESDDVLNSVSFSRDGRYLAAGGKDKTARVMEVATGKQISQMEFGVYVLAVGFSPDGRYIAVSSAEVDRRKNEVRVIEAATGKEISNAAFRDVVLTVSFSPDGRYVATGRGIRGAPGEARVIEAQTGKEISKAKFGREANSVSFSPDGRHLAVGIGDGTARVIETATGTEISKVEFGNVEVWSVSFSPDAQHLAIGSGDGARVIETATGKELSKAVFAGESVHSVSFSPDGRHLAVGSGKTARVIETATGKQIIKAEFGAYVSTVNFSSDGRSLGVVGSEARVMDCDWFTAHEDLFIPWHSALYVQSGVQFQTNGLLAPLSADQLLAAQREVTAFVGANPKPAERWQHAILKWSRMPPEERTTSPWTQEPIRVAIGRWLIQARTDTHTVTDCADQAPWHPLEPVSLARLEPKPDDKTDAAAREAMIIRARYLARLTLKRLREADEKLYGRDTLAEYASWAAKIMHEELHLDPEALDALAFALERTPPEKQKDLLELQARLHPK